MDYEDRPFLAGGGEMGARMRSFDWASGPLGSPSGWPPSLRAALSICLNCGFPVLVMWGDSLLHFYNDGYATILGEKHPAALGRPAQAIWPEIWDTVGPMLKQVLTTGEPARESDLLLRIANGRAEPEDRWFSFSYSPMVDEEGRIVGVFCPVMETTSMVLARRRLEEDADRRRATQRRHDFLFRLEERIRPLRDPEEIAYTSMRLLCDELAADRATYFEVDADSKVGWVLRDYAPRLAPLDGGHVIDAYGPAFASAMRHNQTLVLHDYREAELTPEQRERFEAIQIGAVIIVPLHKEDRLIALVGLYQGQPRRWSDEEIELTRVLVSRCWESVERARIARELRDADRRKDEFIATLAHELRNPLAPLRTSLAVLRTPTKDAPVEKLYAMMERQVDHLASLVDELLDLSRINSGRIVIERTPLDLCEALRNAIDTARPWVEAARHELRIQMPTAPLTVAGDMVRLTQVFANLLNNAAKYTPIGGLITVVASTAGIHHTVRISDTGIGIAPEMRGRIFEMFTQDPRSRDDLRAHGLGIGLALVKSLVELHHGAVRVSSDGLGQGSCFEVELPIAQAAPLAQTQHPHRIAETVQARVLVVDDNRDAADATAMLLHILGAEVQVAYDGASALESIRDALPDVALLDIGMPELDGHELARRIRELGQGSAIRLVALTGWGQEDDRRRSLESGFDDHLVKPVEIDALLRVLRARPAVGGELNESPGGTGEAERSSTSALSSTRH